MVELEIDYMLDKSDWKELSNTVEEENLKIDKIILDIDEIDVESDYDAMNDDVIDDIIDDVVVDFDLQFTFAEIIKNSSLTHLVIDMNLDVHVDYDHTVKTRLSKIINLLSSSCSWDYNSNEINSLSIIQIIGLINIASLDFVGDLFMQKMKIMTVMDLDLLLQCRSGHDRVDSNFLVFSKLCRNVSQVLINGRVPIDIRINVQFVDYQTEKIDFGTVFDTWNSTFLFHFDDSNLLSQNTKSKWKYNVAALEKPHVSLVYDDTNDDKIFVFRASNCTVEFA